MAGNPAVLALLEEMLESGRTPEDVCRDCQELLDEVRRRWKAFRLVDGSLAALFPDPQSSTGIDAVKAPPGSADIPKIPGYDVQCEVGRGGMGVVYRAWHLRLNRAVALKMLLAGRSSRPDALERFRREAETIAGLRHPNIVHVYDVGEVAGRPYFTMEFIEGGDLSEKIQGVPQPAREAAALVATLADAIRVAHQNGIVHRDLKPGNILFAEDGTPKVMDFGLALRLQGEGALTLSGVPLGTPSYMSPEQARGKKEAIGPESDVYALGAILYELLTGRPPFRAESAAATLQQVMADDPVPPARLNPRVPRDVQTIALKCLSKEPHKRYASAQALAEDLRRFDKGEPIMARPEGPVERGLRWLRRHPALALSMLLALVSTVGGAWWHGQWAAAERTAQHDAEIELGEAEKYLRGEDYDKAAASLERSRLRLGKSGPATLHERLDRASDSRELVLRLDAIRLERAMLRQGFSLLSAMILAGPDAPKDPGQMPQGKPPGQRYEEAFREAGMGTPGDVPAEVAARIRASLVRSALVSALDDWAACAADREQQTWVLAVAREADPEPWRDCARDPATWGNIKALRELADRAPVAEQPPHLLNVVAARLRAKGINAESFLRRIVSAYPSDFWANVEMGNALLQSRPAEAIGYYRTALALRPRTVALHYTLSVLYFDQKRYDECLAHGRHAVRLAPDDGWAHCALATALISQRGRIDETIAEFREAIRLDPGLGLAHHNLAAFLEHNRRYEEAVVEYRHALRLYPVHFAADRRKLRDLLLKLGRRDEARAVWKEELAAHPPKHSDWFGYAEMCLFLGDEAEYRSARRDLLSQFGTAEDRRIGERVGRACLLLPAPEGELRQAVALIERAVSGRAGHEVAYPYFLFAEGLARYRQRRCDDAIASMKGEAGSVMGPSPRLVLAMAQYQKGQKDQALTTLAAAVASYDWTASKAGTNEDWIAHVLRREAEALIRPNLPAVQGGSDSP